jgi:hypothetical protein
MGRIAAIGLAIAIAAVAMAQDRRPLVFQVGAELVVPRKTGSLAFRFSRV